MEQTRRIKDLPNLGPVMERQLAAVGITDEGILRKTGVVEAWVRLRFQYGRSISLIALHAMAAALIGCDWRKLPQEMKKTLNAQAKAVDPVATKSRPQRLRR